MRKIAALENMFTPGPIKDWHSISPLLGNTFHTLDGHRIQRGDRLSGHKRLPAVLDTHAVVVGDMIPMTSWGSSLANLLTKTSWDQLRHPLIDDHNRVCELCGQKQTTLDVHEVWSYFITESPKDAIRAPRPSGRPFGIQRLDRLMGLCKACHACFHLGKANVDGHLVVTLERLRLLNRWSKTDIDTYYAQLGKRWSLLNRFDWVLDLSRVHHPDGVITIKSPWRRLDERSLFLTAPNAYGEDNLTGIVGASWGFHRQPAQAAVSTISDLLAGATRP